MRRPDELTERARALRRIPTRAEATLWHHLRRHHLDGHRFRRQHVIKPFIVDFACIEARLIIEVDGDQHADCPADAERDRRLTAQGWRVLRFWNVDVLRNLEGVLDSIRLALMECHDRDS